MVVDEASLFELPPSGLLHAVSALVRLAARDGGAAADALAELLPSSTWLLSLRAAAAQQIGAFGAPRLTALLAALGALPLQAEGSPLPVGFGTPRWALPRAVAAPEQWDQFLAAAVDAFADDLVSRLDAAAGAAAAGLASGAAGGGPPPRALVAPFAGALAVSKKWAMARVDDDYVASPECAERLSAFVEAHWPHLMATLAAIEASVGDDPAEPPPREGAGEEENEEDGPASKAGAAAHAGDGDDGLWRRYRRCELPPWQRYGGAAAGGGEEEAGGDDGAALLASGAAAPAAVEDAAPLPYSKRWRKRRAIAAFVARAQLQARLEPPEASLRAFFEAAAPALPAVAPPPSEEGPHETTPGEVLASNSNPAATTAPPYSLDDLESIVRTLLLLGRAPGEPWLRGLVGVIAARRAEMAPQQMRGFLEGLRFFRTKSSSHQLRDTISILSEWL